MSACALLRRGEKVQAKQGTNKNLLKIVDITLENFDKIGALGALTGLAIKYVAEGELSWEDLTAAATLYTISRMISDVFKYPEIIEDYYKEIKEDNESDENEEDIKKYGTKEYVIIITGRN